LIYAKIPAWENEGVSTEEYEAHPLLRLNAPKQPIFKNAAERKFVTAATLVRYVPYAMS